MSYRFFFSYTSITDIYTLSLHDALPIFPRPNFIRLVQAVSQAWRDNREDRKSTRLKSSHVEISYAVFCLKKKKKYRQSRRRQQNKTKHHNTTPPHTLL